MLNFLQETLDEVSLRENVFGVDVLRIRTTEKTCLEIKAHEIELIDSGVAEALQQAYIGSIGFVHGTLYIGGNEFASINGNILSEEIFHD